MRVTQSARQREAAHLPPEPAFAEGEEFFGRYQHDEDGSGPAVAAAVRRNPADDLAADEFDDSRDGRGYGIWHSSRKVGRPCGARGSETISDHAADSTCLAAKQNSGLVPVGRLLFREFGTVVDQWPWRSSPPSGAGSAKLMN